MSRKRQGGFLAAFAVAFLALMALVALVAPGGAQEAASPATAEETAPAASPSAVSPQTPPAEAGPNAAEEEASADDSAGPSPGFEVLSPDEEGGVSVLPLDSPAGSPSASPQDAAGPPAPGLDTPSPGDEGGFETLTTPRSSSSPLWPRASQDSSPMEDEEAPPLSYREVTLRALDKITARTQDIVVPIDQTVRFKSLSITMRTCNKRPPEEPPETTAFLEISEEKPDGEGVPLFTGWMFASSPGLSALEHPVYDVWVIDCKISAPENDPSNE